MRLLRRHGLALLALLLAGVATVLVLFALDARAWQPSVLRGDVRFRLHPGDAGTWAPSSILPGDPAGLALGAGDTTAWRQAVQSFWYANVGRDPLAPADLITLHARAQSRLLRLASDAKTAVERSGAANLLGVLVITTPGLRQNRDAQILAIKQATQYFQDAIRLDPGDTDAKANLELLLHLIRPGKSRLGKDARAGFGWGRGNASMNLGSGY